MKDIMIKANGIDIKTRIIEANQQPALDTIIFLHYSGANLEMWKPSIPFFNESYRLILIDLRGHGKSSKPASGYHIDNMADDVVGVMNHLNINSAHIVGSSMGAEVGLAVAVKVPNRIKSLVCEGALYSEFGPYGIFEGTEDDFNTFVRKSLKQYEDRVETTAHSIDELIKEMRPQYKDEDHDLWSEDFERILRHGAYEVREGEFITNMSKAVLTGYIKHYYDYKFEDYYSKITCPVLMMPHADPDSDREVAIMNDLSRLASNCKVVHIDKWMHAYGWLIDTESACKATLSFIEDTENK